MTAKRIVEYLLDLDSAACVLLGEASIHRPRRGRIWVAAFRDEHGEPRWRSTGLTDPKAAQATANEMEAEARRKRAELGIQTRPKIRVRAGSGEHALALLTQGEVAVIMRISERAVRAIERRAIAKLRNHPILKEVLRELQGRDIDEGEVRSECQLSQAEMDAVLGLARTPFERSVVRKLLRILATVNHQS